MKRNFFAVSFVLIVLVLISASCKLGVSVSTSGQSTGQRTEEQTGSQTEPQTGSQTKPDKLSGVFTVNSSGKKVQFSKGALYWDGGSFKLEENQYDYRTWNNAPSVINGEYKANNTDIPVGETGLFYWSKDVEKTYALNYDSTGRTTSDTFAFSKDGNDGKGAIEGWDVLSKEEWDYLINRENSNKYGLATITTGQGASVKGLVLLPDNWTLPSGCTWATGHESGWDTNQYNSTQWVSMEQAGAVFLPAAGYRNVSSVSYAGDYGYWWSSTPDSRDGYVHSLNFNADDVSVTGTNNGTNRSLGQGVRLVAPVEN